MAALAFQRRHAFGIFTIGGAKFLTLSRYAATAFHRALLRFCGHWYIPPDLSYPWDAIAFREDVSLPATLQKVFGMFQAGLGQLRPAEHPGDLLCPLCVFHAADIGLRPPLLLG